MERRDQIMSGTWHLFFVLLVAFTGASAQSSDEKTTALLRFRDGKAFIETIVPAKQKPGTSASAAVYKKEKNLSTKVAGNVKVPECKKPLPEAGTVCLSVTSPGRVIIIYGFPTLPDKTDDYVVALTLQDQDKGEIDQIVGVGDDFGDTKPDLQNFDRREKYYTKNGLETVKQSPNGVIKVGINVPKKADPPNKESDAYVSDAVARMYKWLKKKEADPTNIATVRVEPRHEKTGGNLPLVFDVVAFRYDPYEPDEVGERFNVFLITKQELPMDEFDVEVTFKDAPPEISGALLNSLKGTGKIEETSASKAGDDTTLELRDFKTELDASVAFTSSVEEKEENGVKVRKRDNNAVLDLMFAPINNRSLDDNDVHLITPFFIDAKVSNGKITEKTLSLNRILIGSQYAVRWRPDDGRLNDYLFSFRGVNASDRDFKRVEAKFDFEFRPILDRLNSPFKANYEPVKSILNPDADYKYLQKGWFGYEIQPFMGFELGRVYRQKRDPFDVEETSRNLRRFYFGTDLVFNVTKYATITINDKFYVRGESSIARQRNYFKGVIEAPLFFSPRAVQSVFLSFERGDQPPFISPSVNSVKIGYRITSNLFGTK